MTLKLYQGDVWNEKWSLLEILFDIVMTILTTGLWLIVVIVKMMYKNF